MSGFSKETRQRQIESQNHRCALLKLDVDILEGHHCVPKSRGGSNSPHNCVELAGHGAYCVYGVPVEDVHEICDRKALSGQAYLHPDTLEFVSREEMPEDCFRKGKPMEKRRKKSRRTGRKRR